MASVVAGRLGFRLIDEHIIARAAREAGLDPHVVADVELRKSFLKRLLEGLGPTAEDAALAMGGSAVASTREIPTSADLRALIRSAIEEIAEQGSAVIYAHAASIALAKRDDVVRVLITASPETRRARVASDGRLGEKEAAKLVRESDAARAEYLRQFYGVEEEVPTLYDLVVNTDRISPEQAAQLVLEAVRSPTEVAP